MPEINWLAVVAAAAASFLLGGLWYSPLLFARAWQSNAGLSEEALRRRSAALVFGGAFALSLLAAAVFALFLGPRPGLGFAVGAGAAAGACWVAASFGINYLFEQRPFSLFAINGGYHTGQFILFGLVLGLWH
ncbi:MAG TPA: DUF1761 domain-containing protein [Allosphingosinicella sp.]|nr:DUF1761 domain-containing protein [Allosphingosinicella sp.]